ncbi:GtrA family protein [Paraburkholderia phenazinium]|uniref:Putative flippase GtrA (Transmembrane translocase of bactoprenol-linked glucose) n=1 Tax=Paraburkholderia phenazinium TaxID=60549 RepID=A0A1N6LGM4_9BURK|nr:GtrA family protein [Paraburkholderia phenazinium]SIO67928.1 Putative flippase GtrA (transmembrane translocase of bactoprenol-linked glucose) [Paraburkholderia phenazinium]
MQAPDTRQPRAGIEEETVRPGKVGAISDTRTHWQLLRFLIVGGINTVFGYSVFFVLTWLGMRYPLAIGLATIAGVSFNFQSVGHLVFGGAPHSRFWRFVGVYCLIYLLNLGGVRLLLVSGANVYVANAVVLLPLSLIAFLLNRRFVFAHP